MFNSTRWLRQVRLKTRSGYVVAMWWLCGHVLVWWPRFGPAGVLHFPPLCDRICGGSWRSILTTPGKCGGQIHKEKRRARRNTHTRGSKLAQSRPLKKIRGNGLNCPFCLSYFRAFRVAVISFRVSQYGLPLWVATMGCIFFLHFGLPLFWAAKRPSQYAIIICKKKEECTYKAAWATTGAHARRCEKKNQKNGEDTGHCIFGSRKHRKYMSRGSQIKRPSIEVSRPFCFFGDGCPPHFKDAAPPPSKNNVGFWRLGRP